MEEQISVVQPKKSKRRLVAILCMVVPIVALPISLILYPVISLVVGLMGLEASSGGLLFSQIARVALSFLGIISVAGIFIGLPVGVILLVTDKTNNQSVSENKPIEPQSQDNNEQI